MEYDIFISGPQFNHKQGHTVNKSDTEEHVDALEQFVLNNPELERLENLLSQFNIFETLNIVDAEIRHSNVLAWLLNPNANHGLGNYFIKQFMKHLILYNKDNIDGNISLFDFENFSYANIDIRREWKHIDLVIILSEKDKEYVIAIENKVRSSEHSNQLQRYKETVEKEFSGYVQLYVFLTPEALMPSDESWLVFSYETVADIISELIRYKNDRMNENVLSFISNYMTVLRRYIVGKSEVEEICQKIYSGHKEALDLIFQYKPDTYLEVSQYLQQQLAASDRDIIVETTGKTVIRFTTKLLDSLIDRSDSVEWVKSKRIILFEFSNNENGLVLRLYIGPGDNDYRGKLISFCSRHQPLFSVPKKVTTKKWQTVYKKSFLAKSKYQGAEFEDVKAQIDEKLAEFLAGDLPEISECFRAHWGEG
jgi:PD-(D/E)XK nuclease superfamily protein